MNGLVVLNHAAQQQAAGLHAELSKLLGSAAAAPPADASGEATSAQQQQQQQQQQQLLTSQHLQLLAQANAALGRALTAQSSKQQQQQQPGTSEELEEAQEAYSRREQLLGDFLQLLDTSAQALRNQLDSCHKLLETKPCMEDPELIIRYARTLRYGFAPLGSTPGLWQVPPAPQIPFMLHSTLRQYHMELAAQQQQDAAQPDQQQQQQNGQLPLPGMPGIPLQQQEVAAQQQQQQPQQQPAVVQQQLPAAISFALNQDLEDDLETASEEEMSEESYSDD